MVKFYPILYIFIVIQVDFELIFLQLTQIQGGSGKDSSVRVRFPSTSKMFDPLFGSRCASYLDDWLHDSWWYFHIYLWWLNIWVNCKSSVFTAAFEEFPNSPW